jgi:rubrerythrin
MAVIICPWCQSEIIQEEGQEPEKICPVCDNELDGYRTLKLNIGEEDDNDDEDEEDFDDEDREYEDRSSAPMVSIDEDIAWVDDESLIEPDEELQQFEETVEQLLNEQEVVPECPSCHEYMIEFGEQLVSAPQFRPRTAEALGETVLEAPFTLTMYVCPSCFTVQSFLGDSHRHQLVRRLSQAPGSGEREREV